MKSNEISLNEENLLIESLRRGIRFDNRKLDEIRQPQVKLFDENGYVELEWGLSKLAIRVSCDLVKPFEDRPSEGLLTINNEISSMSSIKFDNERNSTEEVLINRIIEKSIRKSNALDLESLCIINGEKVWLIRVDINILNYDGNLIDAACFGTMIGLLSFKLPNYEIEPNQTIKLYNLAERDPINLSILHIPICLSISFYNPLSDEENLKGNLDKEISIFDATAKEELIRDGSLIVTMNSNKELIQLLKFGGIPINSIELINLCEKCSEMAIHLTQLMKDIVKQHKEKKYKEMNLNLLEVGDNRV